MSQPVIKVENLSKLYRLGLVGTGTMAHDLNRWWKMNVMGKADPYAKVGETNDRTHKGTSEFIWALKDINFEVHQGEVLGIIGRNGAGKSTLLKILSKVTTPTTGNLKIRGRIASLLEVGTGFHPELTGRENVYMNGTIMGMKKREIDAKFDEIVDFAGVERYIDTPVKRYSSGMMVRLGFAVAAFLEPEILVIDEVLAVGDADFQKKAMGKMQNVTQGEGRTVLFVSHNMQAVKSLCNSGILLKNGLVSFTGHIDRCVSKYISGDSNSKNLKESNGKPIIELKEIDVLKAGICAKSKDYTQLIELDDEIEFEARYRTKVCDRKFHITIHLKDEYGNKIFSTGSEPSESVGEFCVKTCFPANFFNWGTFAIDLFIIENCQKAIYIEQDILSFSINNRAYEMGQWMGKEPGPIHPNFKWIKV